MKNDKCAGLMNCPAQNQLAVRIAYFNNSSGQSGSYQKNPVAVDAEISARKTNPILTASIHD